MRQGKGSSRRFVDLFASELVADYHVAGRRLKSLAEKCRSQARFDQLLVYLERAATDKHTGACLLAHVVHVSGQLHKKAARMHVGLPRLQSLMVKTVIPQICHYMSSLAGAEVTNTLWSIAVLHIKWSDISTEYQRHILHAVADSMSTMEARDVSTVWWALAKLGLRWQTMPVGLCMPMLIALTKKYPYLGEHDCARLLRSMAMLRVTNSRSMQQLLIALFEHVVALDTHLIADQLAVCFAYHSLKHDFQLRGIDVSCYEDSVRTNIDGSPSYSQQIIQKQLQARLAGRLELKQEVHLHDVPVDIICEDYKIIVEVDGPHHRAAQKRRIDQAHDRMRALDGYTTLRIDLLKFDEMSKRTQDHLLHCIAMAIESNTMHLIDSEAVSVMVAKKVTKPCMRLIDVNGCAATLVKLESNAKRARTTGASI